MYELTKPIIRFWPKPDTANDQMFILVRYFFSNTLSSAVIKASRTVLPPDAGQLMRVYRFGRRGVKRRAAYLARGRPIWYDKGAVR